MNMEVDLDGLFHQNDTFDYDNYEYKDDFETSAIEGVSIPVLYSVALVIGLLGNGLLLAVLAQKRRNWSISDTFILHLSVADLLLLGMLPFWAAQATQSGWCFGSFLCKISGAVFNINFYCGIFLLVCISLDCYLSLVPTTQLYSQKKPRLAHISCLSVWLGCLILTIPDCVFLVAHRDHAQAKTLCVHCYSQSLIYWERVSRLLYHTLGFLLPAAALIICCSCILLRLQRCSESLQKKRAAMVVLPLVAVFLLCWTPYNITLIVETFRSSSKGTDNVVCSNPERSLKKALKVTSALGCIHACLRPLLYLGLCGNFRKRTLAMLRRATDVSKSSLWELGVGEEALPDPNQDAEELKSMTSVEHQVQSSQC
ncbi:C-X-C chemokine receptor type 3-like [Cottoperca gobio]|uniref:C-X-C chemokine receptor type 3-like n=1 Tax=Cottoperca gobio TaxID=56716 RepID=A0A6J2RD04_COTGO|nr:C-X-C chemokine receptor type 3-like [Cottoperca gobio]XP_029307322.1 C-X-C chemokine receptor type 3-like [Cottoperca gobio]XP_029307323.1 C-X-C chemokine receptor type 3-like [Cottoperca gobio]